MKKLIMTGLMASTLATLTASAEDTDNSLATAVKNGTTSGTIGTYFEGTAKDGSGDTSWATGYLQLKHETAEWNRMQFGLSFLSHNQLWSTSDNNSDPYDKDVETEVTMPEMYLKALLTDQTTLVLGRFNHKKVSHIDDAQSEGIYLQTKEIENLDLVVGAIRKYAEIDYDDGEDFGRSGDQQDLTKDDYGNQLFFIEAKTKAAELAKFNPFLMHQTDYATVTGLDTDITLSSDEDVTFGSHIDCYYVATHETDVSDSFNWMIAPYVKSGAFEVTVGYSHFGGSSENKPDWLADKYMPTSDQTVGYGEKDSSVFFAKIKGTVGKTWAHIAIAHNDYEGDEAIELELQGGYQLSDNMDINLRLFDVSFDDSADYQKVEGGVRYRF